MEDFANQNGISTQKAAEVLAEVSAGGGVLFKGSVGAKGSLSATDQKFLQKAVKYAEDTNFQEASRQAVQASQTLSKSTNDDVLTEGITGSFENGIQQRADAAKSFSDSESYSRQAMNTLANSSAINANHNQQFVDWLASQPADHTSGHIGQRAAADIIANQPQLTMQYANKYLGEQGLIPKAPLNMSATSLRKNYQEDTMPQQFSVSNDILSSVREKGQQILPQFPKEKAEALTKENAETLSGIKSSINETKNHIHNEGSAIKNAVTSQQGRYVTKRLGEQVSKEELNTLRDAQETLLGKRVF